MPATCSHKVRNPVRDVRDCLQCLRRWLTKPENLLSCCIKSHYHDQNNTKKKVRKCL